MNNSDSADEEAKKKKSKRSDVQRTLPCSIVAAHLQLSESMEWAWNKLEHSIKQRCSD